MRDLPAVALVLSILTLFGACSSIEETELPETVVIEKGDRIFVVDQTGKEWDITHAGYRYGLQVVHWGQGLGRGAIPPVIEPDMVGFGEVGFPDLENIALVIGLTVDGDARAYKQGDLNNREVVDVVVTGAHLAVTY